MAGAGSSGEELTEAEIAAWCEVPTAVISDETDCVGVMGAMIRPLTPTLRFAGQAITVRTSRTADDAPQRILAALRPGNVIVMDGTAHPDTAVWGGNLISVARARGVSAVVVDGNVRDIADLRRSGLAIYARSVTPAGIPWGGEFNVSIQCGGVEVQPGGLLVGDDDGVVAVPLLGREDLLMRCQARIAFEVAYQERAKTG